MTATLKLEYGIIEGSDKELKVTNTYLFATNLEPKGEFNFDTFVRKRMDLTFEALKQMDIIK